MIETSLHNPDLIVALCNHIRAHGEYLGDVRKGGIWAFAWVCEFAGITFGLERIDDEPYVVSSRSPWYSEPFESNYPAYLFDLIGTGWTLRFRYIQDPPPKLSPHATTGAVTNWIQLAVDKRRNAVHGMPGAIEKVWVDNRDAYREDMTLVTLFSDLLDNVD